MTQNETDVPVFPEGYADKFPEGIPVIYGDQVVDVLYGLHTSKVIIGLEAGATIRRTHAVILPTQALLHMAVNILSNVGDQGMNEEMVGRTMNYLSTLQKVRAMKQVEGDQAKSQDAV